MWCGSIHHRSHKKSMFLVPFFFILKLSYSIERCSDSVLSEKEDGALRETVVPFPLCERSCPGSLSAVVRWTVSLHQRVNSSISAIVKSRFLGVQSCSRYMKNKAFVGKTNEKQEHSFTNLVCWWQPLPENFISASASLHPRKDDHECNLLPYSFS